MAIIKAVKAAIKEAPIEDIVEPTISELKVLPAAAICGTSDTKFALNG